MAAQYLGEVGIRPIPSTGLLPESATTEVGFEPKLRFLCRECDRDVLKSREWADAELAALWAPYSTRRKPILL
jgi:hypothetical protein